MRYASTVFVQCSQSTFHVCISGSVDFSTKKEVFVQCMAVRRLQEEKSILVREMRQHWDALKSRASVLSEFSLHQNEGMWQSKCALQLTGVFHWCKCNHSIKELGVVGPVVLGWICLWL